MAYELSSLNKEIDGSWRHQFDDFFDSERQFLTKDIIGAETRILDVGGAAGGLGNAIAERIEPSIDYTCIDLSRGTIEAGAGMYPNFKFIQGRFPDDMPDGQYDLVTMFALFPQIPDWKEMLTSLVRFSRKFVNISAVTKLSGTTVVDRDVSYAYYLDSGERVHQVVHNLYELINYCCTEEMRVKRISRFGYHTTEVGDNFRCVPNSEQIKGNMLLELFPEEANPPQSRRW